MKIVVTGGAGFVGSHVVDAYIAAGHEVLVVDNLSTGRRARVHPAARFVELDVTDPSLLRLFQEERPDVVNHHAANASVGVAVRRPLFDLHHNVAGTLNLLEAARQAGVRKFIYVSSGGAMYGDPVHLPVDEEHPSDPVSPYGLSKHTAERYVRLYGAQHGLRWTSLRYANVYGPRQDAHGEAGVVAIFCQNLLDGVAPEVHWDGEQSRDFVYVADCARASLLALEGGDGEAYNAGTGLATSVNALLETLAEVAGREVVPRRGPRRPGDVRHSYLDCRKIERDLGWRAETGLREGLARTWTYFQQGPFPTAPAGDEVSAAERPDHGVL